MTPPPAVNVAAITTTQRQALAWRLRDILHEADHRASGWRHSATPQLAEAAKSEYIRGELLGLVAELEGARRLVVAPDDGEAA
jgi:hypothetical protein